MPLAGVTHDLTIADTSSGSPILGFMLARDNGRRNFGIEDFRTIAPRQLTMGELTHAELDPMMELTWSEEDWRAGLGGQNHRLDPKRIAKGYKIDATSKGVLQLARELNVTTDDTAPAAYKPSGFAIVGTEVWSFQERDVYSWDYTNKNWDKGTSPEAVAKVHRNGVEYSGNTYAPAWLTADDSAATYIYKADADANWTLCTLTPKACKYMVKVGGTLWGGNWGSGATHQIRSSTNGTNAGSWSSATSIGQSDSEITGLVAEGNTLLVLKTNGVWASYLDGTVENLTPEIESMAHPDNFRGAYNWNSHVLLPLGAGGLMELNAGKLYDVSMKLYAPDETWLHGRVVAIGGDPTRVFLLIQETATTSYHLVMAEWAEFQNTHDYRWHHVGNITYTTSTVANHSALFAEGVPSGANYHHRVWAGIESGGSNRLPYFYTLGTDDAEDIYTNDTDCEVITGDWDANLPQVPKRFGSIDFTTANLASPSDSTINTNEAVDASETAIDCSADPTGSIAAGDLVAIDNEYMRVDSIQASPALINVTRAQAGTSAATHTTATDIYIVGHHVNVQYRVDGGSWTYITGTQATSRLTTSPQTLTFGAEITGKKIELRFLPFRGSTTTTSPQILSFTLKAQLRASAPKSLVPNIYLADGQVLLNGTRQWAAASDLTQLETWAAQNAEVTVVDARGTSRTMVFLPGQFRVQEVGKRHGHRAEYIVTPQLAAV